MVCRYEQDYEGTPVIGDDLVITYNAGQVKNAYGSAQNLNEANEGHPCNGVTMTKEEAIQLAQEAESKENGEGTF